MEKGGFSKTQFLEENRPREKIFLRQLRGVGFLLKILVSHILYPYLCR